jgi:ribonuclease P protein component
VTYLAGDDGVRVAFAIGRHAGTAVRRNRLRRRLRAILATLDLPEGRYLVAGGAEATALPYDALAAAVREAVDDVVDQGVPR